MKIRRMWLSTFQLVSTSRLSRIDIIYVHIHYTYQLASTILFRVHDELCTLFGSHVILLVELSLALIFNFVLAFNADSFLVEI